ncbi:MAG: phosphoribosylamine--glycine ligase family protein, partial [Trichodesmium sp. St5_bin2_1]|nr:phosphoribosylamine--glycine ligase family protein [Trichodesmium sp. St5_bin2_1]
MKILIIGNGGREHAIAWKLSHSSQVKQIFCTPGNGGTATMAKCQ